jgi:hypothetical protein
MAAYASLKTPFDYMRETSQLAPLLRDQGMRNSETQLKQEACLLSERRNAVETKYNEDNVVTVMRAREFQVSDREMQEYAHQLQDSLNIHHPALMPEPGVARTKISCGISSVSLGAG